MRHSEVQILKYTQQTTFKPVGTKQSYQLNWKINKCLTRQIFSFLCTYILNDFDDLIGGAMRIQFYWYQELTKLQGESYHKSFMVYICSLDPEKF